MTDDERVRVLAAAVADGVPIDWRQAESTASDDERELVRQFKVLATVANIHRNDEGTEPPAPMTPRGRGIRRPSIAGDRWSCASSSAAAATAPCIARGIRNSREMSRSSS